MLIPILLFLLGFIMLIKGGDWFVDGAVGLAHRFHLPELLIGATIVSIGTTLPEVMVSAQAALQGNAGISYGNAIGSVICNTCLIAALTVAIRPSAVKKKALIFPVAAFFTAAALYVGFAYIVGHFTRLNGILLLLLFVAYMMVTVILMKRDSDEPNETTNEDPPKTLWQEVILLVVGAIVIALGANLLVNNGTLIAQALGVPDSVIGLTMVALGTSLPELITAISSLLKGHSALSLGNIIGANLFNIVLVSGTAIAISPFSIPAEKLISGLNASLAIDIPVMLIGMVILCLPAIVRGRLARWQGISLLGLYVCFMIFQFFAQ